MLLGRHLVFFVPNFGEGSVYRKYKKILSLFLSTAPYLHEVYFEYLGILFEV